ncbi:hypothetical protein [Rhodovibrio salinarum]|uniref:Lipoprotein n=1 Tax=Rhodovibrio salinarum TaxID=1087 RepID=A0A934QFR3_9PROT|nr:hypothetical protein [Rhodovibrio salinarum]MBK1695943.1 hypothetical protein [Rhodovibrio salinarum]
MVKRWSAAALALLMLGSVAACGESDNDTAAEEAGDAVEEAGDQASDAVEDAGDAAEDAADEATE